MTYKPAYRWTEESLALLGTMTDYDVARKLKVTQAVVFNQRAIRGIPPFRPKGQHKAGRKCHPWTPEELALLGTMSDQNVANKLYLSYGTVRRKRIELGVEPYDSTRERIDWTEEKIALLGTAPDWVVAEKLGIHKLTVLNKRHQLGISTYQKYSRKQAANPTEQASANTRLGELTLSAVEAGHLSGWLTGLKSLGILDNAPGLSSLLNQLTSQL